MTIGPLDHWTKRNNPGDKDNNAVENIDEENKRKMDHWTTGPKYHWIKGSLDQKAIGTGPKDYWTKRFTGPKDSLDQKTTGQKDH